MMRSNKRTWVRWSPEVQQRGSVGCNPAPHSPAAAITSLCSVCGRVRTGGQCSPECLHPPAPAAKTTLEGPEFPRGAKGAFPEFPTGSPTPPEHLSTRFDPAHTKSSHSKQVSAIRQNSSPFSRRFFFFPKHHPCPRTLPTLAPGPAAHPSLQNPFTEVQPCDSRLPTCCLFQPLPGGKESSCGRRKGR